MLKEFLRVSFLGMVLCAGLALTACNTAEGFGKDLEGAGRTIQDTF